MSKVKKAIFLFVLRTAKYPAFFFFYKKCCACLNIKHPSFLQHYLEDFFIFYWEKIQPEYSTTKKKSKPRLYWGPVPILNNIYWSRALKEVGFESTTIMETVYSINKKSDYDLYHDEILSEARKTIPEFIVSLVSNYFLFDYIIKKFDILHMPCTGSPLQKTRHADYQAKILNEFNIKTVIIPYGGDYQQYSQILNLSLRNALLISYPQSAKNETAVKKRVDYWIQNADIFFSGFQVDAIGRWDLLPFNMLTIDTTVWEPQKVHNIADGINGAVRIVHTPNHRGVKGTEFIIKAIDELKEEGLHIELILLENISNEEVRKIFANDADILIEQIIGGAYAMSAIEGMASSMAVITNLEFEDYTRMFRRYSYLNECPILSATPENIKAQIRTLITDPNLRSELAKAGRGYVEKYHSSQTAAFMFGRIYDRIWYNKDVDLMGMFHPLKKESYNNQSPLINHPLLDNKLLE